MAEHDAAQRAWAPAGRAVIVNGRFLAKPLSGVGRVGREIMREMIAIVRERGEGALRIATPDGAPVPTESDEATGAVPGVLRLNMGAGRLNEQLEIPARWPASTVVSFGNTTPLIARHSVMWIHDTHVFDAPDTYPPAYRLWHNAMLTGAKVRGFDVVTVSEFSRGRLLAHGVSPERLHLIFNGGDHILRAPEDRAVLQATGLESQRFVLVMGSPARHKNMPFAIRALFQGLDPTIKIAVGGLHQAGPYVDGERMIDDPRVVILPKISDGALRVLYREAGCVIVPSLLEGFGLPAAEALFADAPLVLANRTALPEVGGPAAIYFDPMDAADLVRATNEALSAETQARLVAVRPAWREKFRWRAAAGQLVDLLERRAS